MIGRNLGTSYSLRSQESSSQEITFELRLEEPTGIIPDIDDKRREFQRSEELCEDSEAVLRVFSEVS